MGGRRTGRLCHPVHDGARAGQRVRGCLGAGSVDAACAVCLEPARKKGDQPIETYDVRSLGEGRYEMSVRNRGTLGSSTTTCSYLSTDSSASQIR